MLRRGSQVRRYHTWPVLRHQTVGEHSHRLALIVMEVYPACSKELLMAVALHDLSEAISGDMPSTFKWRFPEVGKALNESTTKLETDLGLRVPLSEAEAKILKWCDLAELLVFAIDEVWMGNRNCDEIVKRVAPRLHLSAPNEHAAMFLFNAVREYQDLTGEIVNVHVIV